MKLIKQRPYECYLAVVAMLADVPVDLVRETAAQLAGTPVEWFEWFEDLDWLPVTERNAKGERLCKAFGLPALKASMAVGTVGNNDVGSLHGKGQIAFRAGLTAHTVAYENGIIFDPDPEYPGGMTWQEHQKWRLGLIREPIDEIEVIPVTL